MILSTLSLSLPVSLSQYLFTQTYIIKRFIVSHIYFLKTVNLVLNMFYEY